MYNRSTRCFVPLHGQIPIIDAVYEEEQDNDAEEDEMDEEFDTESEDEP